MPQSADNLERYGVPVAVLVVFLLLVRNRHWILNAPGADSGGEWQRNRNSGPGRVRRGVPSTSVHHPLQADYNGRARGATPGRRATPTRSVHYSGQENYAGEDCTDSSHVEDGHDYDVTDAEENAEDAFTDSEVSLEYLPHPSKSSTSAEAHRSNVRASRSARTSHPVPDDFVEGADGDQPANVHSEISQYPTDIHQTAIDRQCSPPVVRSGTATSILSRDGDRALPEAHVNRRLAPSGSRGSIRSSQPQLRTSTATTPTTQRLASPARFLSASPLQPKAESHEDLDGHLFSDNSLSASISTTQASTSRVPSKVSGHHTVRHDDRSSIDSIPLSSPLPPKRSASRTPSRASLGSRSASVTPLSSPGPRTPLFATPSRDVKVSFASELRTPLLRSGDVTPSSASKSGNRSTRSGEAIQSSPSAGSSASAIRVQARPPSPVTLTPFSRLSSLSPVPSELAERYVRKVSNRKVRTVGEDGPRENVITAWFESSSSELLEYPPDISEHPDLQLGDLFYHTTTDDYQLWIWETDVDGLVRWVRIKFMSERNGLYLTLTPGELKPSWVSYHYALSRQRELRSQGYVFSYDRP